MARRERPLDPDVGPMHQFADDLRRLRAAAGNPTYRVLARCAGYSATTLSEAAGGRRQPTLDVVLAYVGACGGDREVWAKRWHALDAAVRSRPPDPHKEPPSVPRQLPAAVTHFTGRQSELDTLTALIRPAGATDPAVVISAVGGTAGVGKTALVVHWAHQVAAAFPDGQLFVNLRGYHPEHPLEPADVLTRFLAAVHYPGALPSDLDELAACYRTAIAGRRILIVLDNASSVQQVRPLLPGTSSCVVVVTSRDSLAGLVALHSAHRIPVGLLPPAEAEDLLCRLLGHRARADSAATAALAEGCARLPLALRVLAESATTRPGLSLAGLVAELSDQQRRLDLLDAGDDAHAAITAVFSWSVRRLGPGPAALFALVGLHPGPDLDALAAAALAGTDIEPAGRELAALARANLIHPTAPGRYGMHDLLRAYASRLVGSEQPRERRTAAQRRLFDYYLGTAALAMDRLRPADARHRPPIPPTVNPSADLADAHAARAWLDAERPVLVSLARYAANHGWAEHAVSLSAVLFHYLDGGHFADALAIHANAYEAARLTSDLVGQANALRGLGSTDLWLGRQESAGERLQRALAMFQQAGDRSGEARTELSLGLLARRQGRYESSVNHHERSLALSRQTVDIVGEARALTNLGITDARLGHHPAAAELLRHALGLCRRAGDKFGEAHTLTNLGLVEQHLGRLDLAAGHHRRAAALFRQLGNRHGEAHTLDNLGSLYLQLGQQRPATRYLRRALALFRVLGDRDSQAWTRNRLGDAARSRGRHRHAVTEHTAALHLAVEVGSPEQQARAHDGLGQAHHELGELALARHHLEQALTRYTNLELAEADAVRARLTAL
jgi:tetratricopeptide (TPR) repeat protein